MSKKSKHPFLKFNNYNRGVGFPSKKEIDSQIAVVDETFKPIFTTEQDYSIVINGSKFHLEYEDISEILYAIQSCSIGNEEFIMAKRKAEIIAKHLPVSDY